MKNIDGELEKQIEARHATVDGETSTTVYELMVAIEMGQKSVRLEIGVWDRMCGPSL